MSLDGRLGMDELIRSVALLCMYIHVMIDDALDKKLHSHSDNR